MSVATFVQSKPSFFRLMTYFHQVRQKNITKKTEHFLVEAVLAYYYCVQSLFRT